MYVLKRIHTAARSIFFAPLQTARKGALCRNYNPTAAYWNNNASKCDFVLFPTKQWWVGHGDALNTVVQRRECAGHLRTGPFKFINNKQTQWKLQKVRWLCELTSRKPARRRRRNNVDQPCSGFSAWVWRNITDLEDENAINRGGGGYLLTFVVR